MSGVNENYVWIPIFSAFFAFLMALGIGANDVANAFATSVGSKTLTLKSAVIIASFCEFLGAVTLGARVTDTVKEKIADLDEFADEPETLMFAMMCALIGASIWLLIATNMSLPVSTTHAVIGAVAGAALAARGRDAVGWAAIGDIVLSWILSPIISGLFSFAMFYAIRKWILRHSNSYRLAFLSLPVLTFLVFFINTFFIMYEGSPDLNLDDTPAGVAIGAALGIGIGAGVAAYFLANRYILPDLQSDEKDYHMVDKRAASSTSRQNPNEDHPHSTAPSTTPLPFSTSLSNWLPAGFAMEWPEDLHETSMTNATVKDIHENTEEFDPKTEKIFSYMQVLSAIFDSFAHGANDVANSIGPLAAVIEIYQTGEVESESQVPAWVLILGAIGIVIGLATYGHKVMAAIGVQLVKVTPSRGFSIELSSALVVVIASRLEMPISTTHCQVGATLGVGVANSPKSVNWLLMVDVVAGWIITLVFSSFVTGLIFAFGYYTPSF
eukprot:TRINITY_DN5717_c0_g2_i1.p1 TRINITY_DN5717_c0_g2~~TRINITY_DN5717_c0_g2_i1.p1  ORF type:complete len:497 (-),score=95.17 TRINITY_DN5717_c0_g2_i1:772-2262(-)